jgi:proton-dependent oligopeptide transporter, POT family
MFLGLVQYRAGGKYLSPEGLHPVLPSEPVAAARARRQVRWVEFASLAILLGLVVLLATGTVRLDAEAISRNFKWVLIAVTAAFFGWLFLSRGWSREERKRLVVIAVLFVAATVFWMAYEQAGSTLNLFADRNTHNAVLGHRFPPSWYQSLPSLFIILFAPVFAALWIRLGERNPSSPAKFALALLLLTLGFAVMIAAASAASAGALVSPLWLVLSYLLQTLGELCLSPVGLSAMSVLAPVRIEGLVMGVWFLALSVGNYLAGMASSFYETLPLPSLFTIVTLTALATAVILALLIKPIRRMMAEA